MSAAVFNLKRAERAEVEEQYYYNQVERLLDQSADLLERGLKDAAQADELDARKTEFDADIQEFDAINAIELAEQADGKYTHEADASSNEADAQKYLADGYVKQAQSLQNVSDSVRNNAPSWIHKATNLLWHTRDCKDDPECYADQDAITGYELEVSQGNADAALAASNAERDAARSRSSAASINSVWQKKNCGYQVNRWTAHAAAKQARKAASQQPENGLNYSKRKDWLIQRAGRDFRDALERLQIARNGMSLIYGFSDTERWPPVHKVLLAPAANRQDIEDCLLWVRDAIAFLVKFGHRDQACVRALSLRMLANDQLLAKDQWDAGLKEGAWSFTIAEEKYFPTLHVPPPSLLYA